MKDAARSVSSLLKPRYTRDIRWRRDVDISCGAMATFRADGSLSQYDERVTKEAVDCHVAQVGRVMPRWPVE